jgi:two-component sensor histidine kinase
MNPGLSRMGASAIIGIVLVLRRLRGYPVLGYGAAILAIGFASALQWLLREQFAGAPFLTIYPAIIIATVIGGLGPGLFAAVLAGASQFGLFIPGFHWVAFGAYAFDATVCVLLIVLINSTMDVLWTNAELEKQAKQHQFVIAGELHHRIQNLFAVIQGIIRFSIPATGSIEAGELRGRLLERLQSMAVANRAITDSMGEGVPLIELLKTEIRGFRPRFDLSGASEVVLNPKMTQNFALIIHELLTNALKYGALSVPEGRIGVSVIWEPPLLTFIWQEQRAPARAQNGSFGFGSVLLGPFAKSFCQAVDASYGPDGFRYMLKIQSDAIRGLTADRQVLAAE